MTAQQLAFGADFGDYSDIAIPEPVEEPTPLTHCPRCTARLNFDRTGVSGCAICGYEDYAGAGRIDTGATGSSSLPEAERRTGEKSADTRHYRPRGAHYIATSERKGKPTMKRQSEPARGKMRPLRDHHRRIQRERMDQGCTRTLPELQKELVGF